MTASETIAKYAVGNPYIVNPDAPVPPALNADLLRSVFGVKNTIREAWITNAMSTRNCQRFDAAIEYDMNHAPKSTNAKQLREIGIDIPSSDWIRDETDQEIHLVLWQIIYGLATLGVYFTNTNGLTDRDMLNRLCTSVLQDKIADIPPTPDMNEFIDLNGFVKVVDRDHLLPTPIRTQAPLPDLSDLVELLDFPEDPTNN